MSDLYAGPSAWPQPPQQVAASPGPSRPVLVAAALTWVVSTGTALVTALLMVGLVLFLGPVFDEFDAGAGNPRWVVLGIGAAIIVLSAAADVVAWLLYRGHRWARWLLIALSVLAAAGGVFLGYYIVPLGVTLTAVTVIVLLLLPAKAPRTI